MATTASLSNISLNPQHHPHPHLRHPHPHHPPFLNFPKQTHHLNFSLSASHSPSSSPSSSALQKTGRFLTEQDLQKLQSLDNFNYHQELESGFLWIRLMRDEEMDMTVSLLSESFAESMMMANGYVKLMEFLVKNYLVERREKMPHNATLLGIYREKGEEDFELAGTVELTFDGEGANANPPTPVPPRNAPYICNMAVRKPLRRRGIGWHLLKAGEELITQMSSANEVYLHCRIIDEGPFNMYTKSGYDVIKTDSILTLLTLQRRRHLMRKYLPVSENPSGMDISNDELS